jgi:diaminohydroxyphosphoribosylaminopyrimidine deaminase / 5-amino-6-(5-phosphoribosylamino)uracil reductase
MKIRDTRKPSDEYWMSLALAEAMKAKGHTSPNPMVGAVLVKNNKKLSLGFHRRAGLPHAEIEALRKIKNPAGSTLYVTLEPCCHIEKRTPPCTEAIVRSGIKRVVIGALDPNPQVAGRGVRALRRAGIKTEVGVLEEECATLNTFYNHWIVTKKPWVVMKAAASIDGRVALASGQSRWISGSNSRDWVHRLRSEVDGILVGIGTVYRDDPQLTARFRKGVHQPIRIILDPHFKISERAKVFAKNNPAPCWIVVAPSQWAKPKVKRIEKKGGEVMSCPTLADGRFDLKKLLGILGNKGLLSLLVEGGPEVWSSFIKQRCAQELLVFIAPKLLGADAIPMIKALRLKSLKASPKLFLDHFEVIDEDILLGYRFLEARS